MQREGGVESEQLVRYFYTAPPLRRLAPWLVLLLTPVHAQRCLLASIYNGAADNLDAANWSVSNGHSL